MKVIKNNPAINVRTVKIAQKVPVYMTEDEAKELCTQPLVNELLWASRDEEMLAL